jgi:crotonobetainyl-CoA:carnitine CoA-transferase CaiB-like acyl-CoA transferase
MAPAYARDGTVRTRMGADTINVVPHSHYQTATGEWVALACTSDKMFERFAALIGQPGLAERYPTSADRVQHRAEVNAIVAGWIGRHPLKEVIALTQEGEVPCAQIYSIREIFEDPQYAARGNLMHVQDPRVGELVIPAAVPRMSRTPPQFRHTGRALGADNAQVYQELLGLDDARLQALKSEGVI